MADRDLNGDFQRAREKYADGELVMLIDGSGGMPSAFGGDGGDPFIISAEYAVEAKALSTNRVSAFAFGEGVLQIPLDNKETLEKYYPHAASNLIPTFDEIVKRYDEGNIRHPAHIVIVSDGDIYESFSDGRRQAMEKLTAFLRNNPEAMLDVIIPNKHDSGLAAMVRELARNVPENAPRLYVVDTAANLKKSIGKVINERTNAVDNLTDTLRTGSTKPVSQISMSTLRFRKPTETA